MKQKQPETHNYTNRYWGHDYVIVQVYDAGQRLRMMGWGDGISQGDYLLLDDQIGGSTRYRVATVEYCHDPKDMWSITAVFAPRTEFALQPAT